MMASFCFSISGFVVNVKAKSSRFKSLKRKKAGLATGNLTKPNKIMSKPTIKPVTKCVFVCVIGLSLVTGCSDEVDSKSRLAQQEQSAKAEREAREKAEVEKFQKQIHDLESEIESLRSVANLDNSYAVYLETKSNIEGYSEWRKKNLSESKEALSQIPAKQDELKAIQGKFYAYTNKTDDFDSRMEAKEMFRRRMQMEYGDTSGSSKTTPTIYSISSERAEKYYGTAAREEMREYLNQHGSPNPSESDIDFALKANERLEYHSEQAREHPELYK